MNSTSTIELSRKALQNNIDFIKNEIGPDVKFSSVIKGNSYGHGIKEFVRLAVDCGVDHFSVFSADEAYEAACCLEDGNYNIMVMGYLDDESLEWAIENDIEFYVFEEDRLLKSLSLARKFNKKAKIHIEVETGMNRTGFHEDELPGIFHILKSNAGSLEFIGLCTHFAGAESIANYHRVQDQLQLFNHIYDYFKKEGFDNFIRHSACSAALIMFPETRMDMVRVGIMQYGLWPSPETYLRFLGDQPEQTDPLKRVMRWKSKVIATKEVKTGEFIGYGTSYLAENHMKVAIIPVGYSNGYSRTLSNQGRILINGHRVGVVGIVNMNMLIADISEVPETKINDEVVLIGSQGDMTITVSSFSEYSDLLNYETLARLPHNINRKITD